MRMRRAEKHRKIFIPLNLPSLVLLCLPLSFVIFHVIIRFIIVQNSLGLIGDLMKHKSHLKLICQLSSLLLALEVKNLFSLPTFSDLEECLLQVTVAELHKPLCSDHGISSFLRSRTQINTWAQRVKCDEAHLRQLSALFIVDELRCDVVGPQDWANFIRLNSATSLMLLLGVAAALMSSEICELLTSEYRQWSGLVRAILREGKWEQKYTQGRREGANEQSESALFKCQRCVRSSSDSRPLQA